VERFFRLSVVYLDITNFCNYRCAHCGFAAHRWTDERDIRKYMPFEEARGYIHKVERGLRIMEQAYGIRYDRRRIIIHPQGGGEPLIHPDFHAIIREITRFGYSTRLTTNGSMLHGERAQALLDANLNELHISIDAASEETYAAIRQKGMYNRVVRNVENFIVQCRRMKPKPHITVSLCHSPFNRNDWKRFANTGPPGPTTYGFSATCPCMAKRAPNTRASTPAPGLLLAAAGLLLGELRRRHHRLPVRLRPGRQPRRPELRGHVPLPGAHPDLRVPRAGPLRRGGRLPRLRALDRQIPLEDEKLIAIKGRAYRLKRTHEDVRIYNSIGQRVVDLNDPSFCRPLREDEP
jgi:organic radical activating enzyme